MKVTLARGKPKASGTATCAGCGIEFRHYPSRIARAKRSYCSSACQQRDRAGERNPKWRGGLAKRHCRCCGRVFLVFQATVRAGEGVYCSLACKARGQRVYPDQVIAAREHRRRREARQRAGRAIESHTYDEWVALQAGYGNRCARCGLRRKLTRDHIKPLSKGGHDGIANIQPLCHSCNARKGNRT